MKKYQMPNVEVCNVSTMQILMGSNEEKIQPSDPIIPTGAPRHGL